MTRLLLVGIGVVAVLGLAPAQDQNADDRVKVEVTLATEHVPKELKAGARVDLKFVTGKNVSATGATVYTSQLWAANFEVASVTAVDKPASPEEAVRVQLFVAKDKAKGVESFRDTKIEVIERQADGSAVRKKKPLILRLELFNPNKVPARGVETKAVGIKVRPDKDNVIAGKLEGAWVRDSDLSKRLAKGSRGGRGGHETISFKSDSSAAARVPQKHHDFFADKRVYMSGTVTLTTANEPQEAVFLLVALNGNLHVFWFPERDGIPSKLPRDFKVMLAPAVQRADDILFVGGEFNQQHFAAYQRVKAK